VLANASTTATATFTAPVTVSITAPGPRTTVSSKVIVSANAVAVTGISNVQFKLDGNNLGGKDTSVPYTVSWDTTRTSNGSHTLTAVATNKAGVTATATITVTVMNPSITAVSASAVSSTAATIQWTTSEGSDSQVDYGATTGYGASTAINSTRVTSHTQTLSGLAAGTLYHFRVKSRNASGNLAVSGDFTFTTAAAAGSGGGSAQAVVWTGLVNATATANSLQKTGGCGGCDDAGGYSQQQIASGNGYVQFTANELAALRYVGLSRNAASTGASGINFAIRLQSGRAEIRESGTYRGETVFATGDTFRIAIESGVVKYSKNGTVFYTSGAAPVYPLQVDASLLDLGSTVGNALISF